jgi:hypothetical protein
MSDLLSVSLQNFSNCWQSVLPSVRESEIKGLAFLIGNFQKREIAVGS